MKERKLRIEDALSATRAAVEEGIVAGGGIALLNAHARLCKLSWPHYDGDEKTGVQHRAAAPWRSPCARSPTNAGVEGSVIVENDQAQPTRVGYGYDAAKDEYVDMIAARHHRPHQGDPLRAAERRVRGRDGADHREPRRRHPRRPNPLLPLAARGWHGRHVLSRISNEQNWPARHLPCGPFPVVCFIE